MRKDVKTRIRLRVLARLDETGMTARELARSVGHDDAWISGILRGSQGLPWKDFDAVADKLSLSPSELVRYDDAILRELSPAEMRMLRHFQNWPPTIRDAWLEILDYFVGSMPDKDTGALLTRLQKMPRSVRRPVLAWLFRLLEEGIPPEAVTGGVVLGSDEGASESDTTRRADPVRTLRDTRPPSGGPRGAALDGYDRRTLGKKTPKRKRDGGSTRGDSRG